jgi:hypothetical protein
MAILPGFPGLEAFVNVRKTRCQEYPEPEDSNEDTPTSVTNYIEAEEGVNFEVEINVLKTFKWINYDISVDVKVDDKLVLKPLFQTTNIPHVTRFVDGIDVKTKDKWTKRKLMFSVLSTGKNTLDFCAIHLLSSLLRRSACEKDRPTYEGSSCKAWPNHSGILSRQSRHACC